MPDTSTTPPDYYEVLQVSPNADGEFIEAAYKRLVDKWNGERQPGDAGAFEKLTLLDKAFANLGDPQKRIEYNRTRQERPDQSHEPYASNCDSTTPPPAAFLLVQDSVPTVPVKADTAARTSILGVFAWIAFTVGAILFLWAQPLNPALVAINLVGHGILWVPALVLIRKKKRIGAAVLSTLFLIDASLEFYVEIESARINAKYPTPNLSAHDGRHNQTTSSAPTVPIDAMRHMEKGKSLYKSEEYDNALREFDAAISFDPNCSEAYSYRGSIWFGKGQYVNAINDCTKAINLNPNDVPAYIYRGQSCVEKKLYSRAIEDFNTVIRIDDDIPTKAIAYASRSAAWQQLGSFDNAKKDREEAARLDPTKFPRNASDAKSPTPPAATISEAQRHLQKGTTLYKNKDYDAAMKEVDAAISLVPNSHEALHSRGAIWFEKRQFTYAIEDCTKAINQYPRDVAAYIVRGRAYIETKLYSKAIDDFDSVLHIENDTFTRAAAHSFRSVAYEQLGYIDEAKKDREEAARLEPKVFGKK
ncbi:MAG TPA: tetratricopeptide repeat protein [Fimbriiglobus sp.]|jgi:tetratricopeptide (TPR) repeat protein